MSQKILMATVGFPRAGKTTWARRQGFPIVQPDAIRKVLTGQVFFAKAEPHVWAIAHTMVESLFEAHDTVILDACNVTRARRKEWINKPAWRTWFVHIPTPWQVCYERACLEQNSSLREVIERMGRKFEPLGEEEESYEGFQPHRESLQDK